MTATERYQWAMKSIAFECDREYILRDDGGPRLVTTSDLLLFHENGSYEVISKDNLQSIYRLDFSLDSNIRIYQKKVPCYVSKISEPFLVKQNSYYRQGNANEYFVQDLCAPFYQYVFSEQDYLKYLTVIMKSEDENVAQPDQDADAGYDGEEHEIDHHEEEEDNEEDVEVIETDHLEEKYAKVGARSSFFTRKFWNFHGENALAPPEEEDQISDPGNQRGSRRRNFESKKSPVAGDDFDIQSIASGDYLEPTEIPAPIILSEVSDQTTPHVGLPLTWNLKQGKYLGVVIHSSSFSIEFQDYPLTPQSERFRGRKGDFIVLNCRGYIFGILSPIDFSRLCDSQPFGYSPGNPENDHSSLHIIHNFLANKILTMQVQSISSALWDGSIELGRVGDYLMQLDFPGNSSMKFVTRSVNCSSSDGSTGSLVIEDSIVSNDLYQWIASASDLEEYFSSFPHKSSPVLMEETKSTKSHHPISIQNSTPPILKALIQEEQLAEMKEEEAHPCALAEPIIAPNSWINRRDSLSIQQEVLLMPSILHYFSPFDIFTKDTCCWYGKLDRYLKKKSTWKTANFIIYCDRICLIPLDSKKRRKSLTTRTAAATTATAATGTGIATGGGDGLKRMKYFNLSDCTDITIGTLNYRDCIQLHGIGKKKSHEEKKTLTVKSVFGAIPALFSPKDDSEYFAIRNQSRTQSIRDLGTLFERESFVNMNAIKQGELFKLFQECYLFGKRQKLYQLTYQLFEKEEEENRRGAGAGGGANGAGAGSKTLGFKKPSASSSSTSVSFNSMIEFFEDPKLSLSQIERILTSPVDESDGMLYLHKLASYPYQASVEITQFLLEKFYNSIPSISPLRLCCQQQVDALHIAIRCNNLKMIKYFFHPQAPCSKEFRTSPYFVELSIQSYLCYTTTPTMFDLISSYYSPPLNLFTILDSQENTLLMLLLSRGSTSVVLHLLQTIPFLELFSMNQTNVTNYFKILNWKHQHALSLALSLFTFYSNTLTDSLCLEIQKVIMLLLEHGCDPNLSDLNGNNSIHLISSLFLTLLTNNSQRMIGYQMKLKTYLSIMKLFIQSHCDLLALNNKGETGLSIISQMTDYSIPEDTLKEVVDTLIGMPQDNGQAMSPHSGAGAGRTRSFSGAEVGNHLSKQLSIVNHSFGSRALFHSPHSPLHICAYNGHSRLLSHLINRGGDIHRQNQFGEKPMDIILKRQQTLQTLLPSPTVALLQHGLDECFTLLIEQKGNVKYHLERRKSTWNLKSRSSNDVIYGRHKDGHYEIQSGLVSALVPLLCQDKYSANEDDIRAVVSSYHLVAYNHVDVLRLVLGVIHEQIRQRQTPPEDRPVVGESDGVNDKEEEELDFKGVLSFLVVWFSWKRNELEYFLLGDPKHDFSRLLREVIDLLLRHGKQLFPNEIEDLLLSENDLECFSGFLRLNAGPDQPNQHRSFSGLLESRPAARQVSDSTLDCFFLSLDPVEVVQQSCLAMHELLQRIPLEEFLAPKYDDPLCCPNLILLKQMKDRLKSYFINEILSQTSLTNRSKIIHHLLSCAFLAFEIYFNYELIEVIYSVFSDQPIYRLKKTFAYVESQYPHHLQRFYDLAGQGCRNLKKLKSQQSSPPVIPPLGLYCGDLRKLSHWPLVLEHHHPHEEQDRNGEELKEVADREKTRKMSLNISKLRSQSCILRDIQKAQEIPYRLRLDERIQSELMNCPMFCMEEKVLDARSYQLEAGGSV